MLKRLRLWEQRRQSLRKFAQKAPQPPALKPPSTARTAGRSDRAECRLRRQPFILLFVTASSIPLVSAENGENSLIPLRLLFPPNPLRWASAGDLFSSTNRPTCLRYAEGASHMARENPLQSGFKSHSHKRPTFAFTDESGYTLAFVSRIAHSGSHAETRGISDGGAISTLGPFCVGRRPYAAGWQNGVLCRFWALVGCASEERREPAEQRCAHARRCSEAARPRWAA